MSAGEIRATDAPVDDPYGEDAAVRAIAYEQREMDAAWLLSDLIDFRKKYGVKALLQLLPACVDGQRDLPL